MWPYRGIIYLLWIGLQLRREWSVCIKRQMSAERSLHLSESWSSIALKELSSWEVSFPWNCDCFPAGLPLAHRVLENNTVKIATPMLADLRTKAMEAVWLTQMGRNKSDHNSHVEIPYIPFSFIKQARLKYNMKNLNFGTSVGKNYTSCNVLNCPCVMQISTYRIYPQVFL